VNEWYQQGITFNRSGEYQKAIDVWQKVYQARPNHPSVVEDIDAARRRLEAEE
jgi:outer membrane protein assembly factor BamD (BamD/ComL family)